MSIIKILTSWFNAACSHSRESDDWLDIATAPLEQDIELAVVGSETRSLPFPCARIGDNWINVQTGKTIDTAPTHWRALPRMLYCSCCC